MAVDGRTRVIDGAVPPSVRVGLVSNAESVSFELKGGYSDSTGAGFEDGPGIARIIGGKIVVESFRGRVCEYSGAVDLLPVGSQSSFVIRDVMIGIDFHWERRQDQEFRGILSLVPGDDGHLTVINVIDVESYLFSVISSEMSSTARPELLRAHAVISRSWLLAQLPDSKPSSIDSSGPPAPSAGEIIRWYDRQNHATFDVCADDHCQRYQGITRAATPEVFEAVERTRGEVLRFDGELCDARFSKSCGGMTEGFSAAWADVDLPYLAISYDGEGIPAGYALPLDVEENAGRWIRGTPPAFCNTDDPLILARILPDFDQETNNFYRWRVRISQQELQRLLPDKLGIDLGPITALEPLERGGSGRIVRLRITGRDGSIIIGKELEIRRALSKSHLFSSAFVVEPEGGEIPDAFILYGAGWGHGVGLCQIGAALMAEKGYTYRQILGHYYHHSVLERLY